MVFSTFYISNKMPSHFHNNIAHLHAPIPTKKLRLVIHLFETCKTLYFRLGHNNTLIAYCGMLQTVYQMRMNLKPTFHYPWHQLTILNFAPTGSFTEL